MKPHPLRTIGIASLLPIVAVAQTSAPQPSATQAAASPAAEGRFPIPAVLPPVLDGTAASAYLTPVLEASAATSTPSLVAAPKEAATPNASPSAALQATLVPTQGSIVPTKGEIRLNFQNASLADVLNYLSEAAGFVILQEAPVSGTVTIVSRQAINADEAIDLLNAVLIEKGYAAIRNGRILKIVSRSDAQKRDLPVMAGSDPAQIPRKDQVVTQVLPLRYLEATKLIENLRPLLSPDATISANESSNSILLGDTQTNIHRIAEIIHALDTSVSSISTIRVFQLQYADSKSLSTVLTQLFATDASRTGGNTQQSGRGGRGGPFAAFFGGGRGGNNNDAQAQSLAQEAALRVVAVSDDQSNSVIVSAPEEVMTTITEIINRIDTPTTAVTETRIFRLLHADATEMSNILNSLYSTTGTQPTQGGSTANQRSNPFQQQQRAAQASTTSQRILQQTTVVTVPDPRTNSILVNAARDTMEQIALNIGRLDATDSKKQHVYIYSLQNADPDNVATILRGMFSSQNNSSTTGAQPTSSALNQRTTTGASSDVTNTINTSNGNSGSSLR